MKKTMLIVLTVLLAAMCGYAETKSDKSGKDDKPVIKTPKFVKALKAKKKQHIAVFGCSLTSRNEWPVLLKEELDKRFPGLVTVTNVAASGMQISWANHNVNPRVTETKADVVFVEFGINDARDNRMSAETVKGILGGVVKQLQDGMPGVEVILMTMNGATGNQGRRRPNQANIYKAYVDYAAENGLLCIDNYPNWIKSIQDGTFPKYCPDGLHPNAMGYKEVVIPEMVKMLNLDAKEPKKAGEAFVVPADKQEMRSWTSAQGKTIEAQLEKVSSGQAALKLKDGKKVAISVNKLSEQDQEYIRSVVGE